MSDIYGLLSKMSPEYLVQMAEEEISKAKKAQEKGRPLPDLTHISVIIFTRSFDRLPQSIWQDLSFLLINVFRGKRGRPSTDQKDIELTKKYIKLISEGKKDAVAITILAKERNHIDERSTRRALARGKKLYSEQLLQTSRLLEESLREKGLTPSSNALVNYMALALMTDKKE